MKRAARRRLEHATPNAQQLQALKLFAAAQGRNWKSELRNLWMTGAYHRAALGGADPGYLQQVRNELGPAWLIRFSLSGVAANVTQRKDSQ